MHAVKSGRHTHTNTHIQAYHEVDVARVLILVALHQICITTLLAFYKSPANQNLIHTRFAVVKLGHPRCRYRLLCNAVGVVAVHKARAQPHHISILSYYIRDIGMQIGAKKWQFAYMDLVYRE